MVGRIRTVKPEFFLHEELYDLEKESGLPIRLAYVGLWTQCDRAGRFKWRPRTLKAAILPHDECDFSVVLDVLATRGFILKYAMPTREARVSHASPTRNQNVNGAPGGEVFGLIPTFVDHQVINNKEKDSELPDPAKGTILSPCESTSSNAMPTREARVSHASPTRNRDGKAEGKGREGKGREGKEGASFASLIPPSLSTERFAEAWTKWERHRREIKKPLTKTSSEQQLKKFCDWGEHRSVAAIEHTIAMGWQGIREPDSKSVDPASRIVQPHEAKYVTQKSMRTGELDFSGGADDE